VFDPADEAERVVLDVSAAQRWVAERYPHEIVERDADGGLRIALNVVGEAWLERLLLRLGPGAVVVEPPHLRTLQRDAARRLLSRYARN
jgi:proteasome accessory factor C